MKKSGGGMGDFYETGYNAIHVGRIFKFYEKGGKEQPNHPEVPAGAGKAPYIFQGERA